MSRFSLRGRGCAGPPEVVQEALADLKIGLVIDMARYGAQKRPMCLTCVPVTLCRKTFVGVGVGGGHKLPLHYIEHPSCIYLQITYNTHREH